MISGEFRDFQKLRKFGRQSEAALEETSAVAPPQPNFATEQDAIENGVTAQHQSMPDDDWQPLDDRDSEPIEPGPSQYVQRVISRGRANKENVRVSERSGLPKPRSFISPQPDARRIDWDEGSQEGTQREQAKTQQSPRQVPGKRPRPSEPVEEEEEEGVSNDEGYENDRRQPAAADRRRQELNAAKQAKQRARSPPKRSRTEPTESSGPADDRATSQSPLFEYDINRQTQNNVRRPTQITVRAHPKPPQRRREWSLDEETALLTYIEEYGTSWSMIKQIDTGNSLSNDEECNGPNRLKGRDQVALKDKARNMRFDYHK